MYNRYYFSTTTKKSLKDCSFKGFKKVKIGSKASLHRSLLLPCVLSALILVKPYQDQLQ